MPGSQLYEALPRIARQVRGFHLLGAGGTWENVVLADAVQLTGWSFPCRKVDRSPLQYGFDRLSLSATLPSFGVLHCDLDGAGRSYAPVTRSELALHQPPRGWLLGHVHQPSALSPGAPIGYLGSLMGLDPNEKGAHGPWLLGVGPQGIDLEHQALSPLRWEEINISDSAVIDSDDAMEICAHACKNAHEAVMTSPFLPRAVGCRIRMSGRSRHAARLRRALELNEFTQYRAFIDGVLYFIDKVHLDLQLPIDLAARAQGNDPVGILARHLLALETGDPAAASLLATTRAGLERELDNIAYYQRLPVVELSDGQVRDLLLQAGRQALERLVLAREESP